MFSWNDFPVHPILNFLIRATFYVVIGLCILLAFFKYMFLLDDTKDSVNHKHVKWYDLSMFMVKLDIILVLFKIIS